MEECHCPSTVPGGRNFFTLVVDEKTDRYIVKTRAQKMAK